MEGACHSRDVGVKAIESLMEKKGKFDYILLETTGLADPGPIAAMFWLDDDLGSEIYLDGTTYILIDLKNNVIWSWLFASAVAYEDIFTNQYRYCHSCGFKTHLSGINTLL